MHGRLWASFALLVVLGGAFAGCVSSPSFQDATTPEVSARQNLGLAASAAKAWNEDAYLVAVAAAETRLPDEELPADPAIANGLAVQWAYVYQTEEGDSRAFEVGADGTVISKNQSDAEADYAAMYGGYGGYSSYSKASGSSVSSSKMEAIEDWTIDSHEALAIALENETFARAAHAPNATLAEGLGATGPSMWAFVAFAKRTIMVALVNATSGELVGVQDLSRMGAMGLSPNAFTSTPQAKKAAAAAAPEPDPVEVKDSGTLDAGDVPREIPFTTEGALNGTLEMLASYQGDATSVTWQIKQGERVVRAGSTSSAFVGGGVMGSTHAWKIAIEAAGDYVLVLHLDTVQDIVPAGSASYDLVMELLPPGAEDDDERDA